MTFLVSHDGKSSSLIISGGLRTWGSDHFLKHFQTKLSFQCYSPSISTPLTSFCVLPASNSGVFAGFLLVTCLVSPWFLLHHWDLTFLGSSKSFATLHPFSIFMCCSLGWLSTLNKDEICGVFFLLLLFSLLFLREVVWVRSYNLELKTLHFLFLVLQMPWIRYRCWSFTSGVPALWDILFLSLIFPPGQFQVIF